MSEVLTSQARSGKCVLLVLEEKSSRVVEVLLAAVPPTRLLAGKVLGIGLTVFLQASLAVVVALVLGYAFYAWVYAAAGSMASRQDQVQALAFPLGLPVIYGYLIAVATATSGNPSLFFHVLTYLPPTPRSPCRC